MPGKRKFNPRLAKIHRSYTVEELAWLFGVHKQTVRNWIDAGLPVLASKRPILIHGSDVRTFHEQRRQKQRQKCRPGELFCLKCRTPRRPAGEMLDYLPMSLVSGNFRGICPTCDRFIHRRVSLAKIDAARGNCTVEYPHGQQRLTALAHELASDGLLPDAGKKAHADMHKALDAVRTRHGDKIVAARSKVQTVEGLTGTADLKRGSLSFNQFLEEADLAVIDSVFRRTARAISPDVARTYAEYLAQKSSVHEYDPEEALVEARADIAALALVPEVQEYLDAEAEKLAKSWMAKHRVAIKALSDERQESYRQIKEMSADPGQVDLALPSTWIVPTTAREANGAETLLPTYSNHMMCREDGLFPAELNAWEREVLDIETKRTGFVAWYRNPQRSSRESLGAAYTDGTQTRIVRPDFIIFSKQADGKIAAAIVDPHGTHFSDSMPKLRGLAAYAEKHGSAVRRIDSIAKLGDKLRVVDLMDVAVRGAIASMDDARTETAPQFRTVR